MLKMHERAKEKGITAIIGMGASPGLTNMLARVAMQQLDTVDTVYTGWSLEGASPDAESSQTGANCSHGARNPSSNGKSHDKAKRQRRNGETFERGGGYFSRL